MDVREIRLVKGEESWVIRYAAGDEPAVLDALVEMVNLPGLLFDWFDAAVLSHQLGTKLAADLKPFAVKP